MQGVKLDKSFEVAYLFWNEEQSFHECSESSNIKEVLTTCEICAPYTQNIMVTKSSGEPQAEKAKKN